MTSGWERYAERYRADHANEPRHAGATRVGFRRFITIVLLLSVMAIAALMPLSVVVGAVSSIVANNAGTAAGLFVFTAAFVAAGWVLANVAVAYGSANRPSTWWRWAPPVLTAVVVGAAAAEMVSGSKAPDPILALWLAAFAWLLVMAPTAGDSWAPLIRVCWLVAPLAVLVLVPFVATDGYFSIRFDRAVDEFDAFVVEYDRGAPFESGQRIGGFTIDFRGDYRGCEQAFRISGWHENDTRWIAYCPDGRPDDEVDHLNGAWYEFELNRGR